MSEQVDVEALVERVRLVNDYCVHKGHDGIASAPEDGPLCIRCQSDAALDSLTAALEREKRSEWREGLVNVLDHEGNYLGCLGSETWQWTLDGGIAELKAALERVERERGEERITALVNRNDADIRWGHEQRERAEAAEARAQKAEAVVEAMREIAGGHISPVFRAVTALAAFSEPPAGEGDVT